PVHVRDRDAQVASRGEKADQAAVGRAVQQQFVSPSCDDHGGDVREAVGNQAHVAEYSLVKDPVDRFPVVVPAIWLAPYPGSLARDDLIVHRRWPVFRGANERPQPPLAWSGPAVWEVAVTAPVSVVRLAPLRSRTDWLPT